VDGEKTPAGAIIADPQHLPISLFTITIMVWFDLNSFF
jgi:hypothetical protein